MNDFEQVLMDLEELIGPKKYSNGWNPRECIDPAHNAPMLLYIPPGQTHIHNCPGCGQQCVLHGSSLRFA